MSFHDDDCRVSQPIWQAVRQKDFSPKLAMEEVIDWLNFYNHERLQ